MPPLKSAETKVPVERSQQQLVTLLRKYGAREFGFDEDPATEAAAVRFMIESSTGYPLPVRIEVSVRRVRERLYEGKKLTYRRGEAESRKAQSHRTAWRLLVDWIDAALTTVAMGAQRVEEAFLPHVMLTLHDGSQGRVVDQLAPVLEHRTAFPRLGAGA